MKNTLKYLFGLIAYFLGINIHQEYINISPYNYPKPNDPDYDYIAVVETTDTHGYGLERATKSESEDPTMFNKTYKHGGGSLFSKYLEAIKKEWGKERILYLDGGDKYQGGIESTLSNGEIMTEISNYLKLEGNCMGNHEFDNGLNYLKNQIEISQFSWITSNLRKNNSIDDLYPFTEDKNKIIKKKIIKLYNGIKIGVIGHTPYLGYYSKESNITDINFLKLKDYILDIAKELKELDNVNAVILLIHNGIFCKNSSNILSIYTKDNSTEKNCDLISTENNELYNFLMTDGKGYIDAVLGGHVHTPSHTFFNGIPIIHNKDRFDTFNIMYLPFNKKTHKLENDYIKIEGPIPICNLISTRTNECGYNEKYDKMLPFYFHNYIIRFDEKMERKILNKYKSIITKYSKYLCYNKDGIYSRGKGENLISNLVTDAIKYSTSSDFAIINSGAFRTTWYPGDITLEDVYNMYSFKADIITFEINGKDLYKLIETIQNGKRAIYPCSGFRQFLSKNNLTNKYKVEKLTLMDGVTLIDKNKIYTISTNSFLAEGGDDFSTVLDLIKNKKVCSEIRSAIENFLIKEKVLISENYFKNEPKDRRIVFI